MGSPEPCIYRVSRAIRQANPGAYTPQMVLIGPLHRSPKLLPKSSKDDDAETSSNKKHLHFKKKKGKKFKTMEFQKKTYVQSFEERVGEEIIEEMKKTIEAEAENIKGSYAEKDVIDEMTSEFFLNLIYKDSIFIMEFIMKLREGHGSSESLIVSHPIDSARVIADLMLLENQLPYFILDRLFSPHLKTLGIYETLDRVILELFSLHTKVKRNTTFKHFTDMFRCAYEESLDKTPSLTDLSGPAIAEMQNAGNLSRVGVEFKAYNLLNSSQQNRIRHQDPQPLDLLSLPISIRKEVDDYSLHVAFSKSCLVMSTFHASEASERILRNVIAYEQRHVTLTPFTSNYIHFINFLITSDRDVEVLIEEGVLTNGVGRPSLVVEMVNRLKVGLREAAHSQYYGIAMNLRVRYKSRRKRCWATLTKVYFNDLWTGTATLAAILLLFLTLVGTVASVLQAYKSFEPTTQSHP